MAYWFNVDSRQVESDDDKSQGAQLMGPYDSREAAAAALDTAHKNTEEWDAEDKAWNEGDSRS